MDGFQVDLAALEDAATGINEVLNELRSANVGLIADAHSDLGNARLAEAVGDFCARWKIGVEHLARDGQQVAVRLSRSVQAYLAVDAVAVDRWDGLLRRTNGSDPALPT